MGNEPDAVGVPESSPWWLKARPAGNAPVSIQVNGGRPLATVNWKANGRFSPPLGGAVLLMVGGGGLEMATAGGAAPPPPPQALRKQTPERESTSRKMFFMIPPRKKLNFRRIPKRRSPRR